MFNIYEKAREAQKYFDDNKLGCEVYPYDNDLPVIVVSIHWGDWKHEHLRADWLAEQKDWVYVKTQVTEENGSDCYSANHYYIVR